MAELGFQLGLSSDSKACVFSSPFRHSVDKASHFLNFSTSNTPLSDAVVWQRNPKTTVCWFRVDLSNGHGTEQRLQSRPWEFQEILSQWDEFQGPPPPVTSLSCTGYDPTPIGQEIITSPDIVLLFRLMPVLLLLHLIMKPRRSVSP